MCSIISVFKKENYEIRSFVKFDKCACISMELDEQQQ